MRPADYDAVVALCRQSEGIVLCESDSSEGLRAVPGAVGPIVIAHRPFVGRKFCTNRRVVSLQTVPAKLSTCGNAVADGHLLTLCNPAASLLLKSLPQTRESIRAFIMNLGQFTEPKLLVPQLVSEWRDSAISELSQHLENAGRVENANAFTHAVLDHESLVSAVFDEVAFSLGRGKAVKELSFALGLLSQGVRWGVGRTPIVHTVILFAVPILEGQTYDSLVLTFARFLKDAIAFSALRHCTQPGQMWTVPSHVSCVRTGPIAVSDQR